MKNRKVYFHNPMKNKILLTCFLLACILLSSISSSYCQQGALQGKILDKVTKEGIPFASVSLMVNGRLFAATTSDMDGKYVIKTIPIGKYDLKATEVGFNTYLFKSIQIKQDSTTFQNIQLIMDTIQNLRNIEIKKPAIYLYPTKTEEIKVKLNFKGKIGNTYPVYDNGWDVSTEPDGKLMNMDNKRSYNYLFWDGTYTFPKEHYNYRTGFIVKKNELANFLQSKLGYMGLNNTEINDFIVYWLPIMNKNETNLVHFWVNDNIDNSAFLFVMPKPDTEITVFMEFRKAESGQTIHEQQLPSTERKGFTVVEWGGSEADGIIN